MEVTQAALTEYSIPIGTFVAFGVVVFLTLLLPLVLLIVFAVKRKLKAMPFLGGTLVFFVTQLLLRTQLLQLLDTRVDLEAFSAANTLLYTFLMSLSSGLFEESGRLLGAKLLKQYHSFKDMLSFGLGHACCELFLLSGLGYGANLLLSLMLNDPSSAQMLTAEMEPNQIAEMYAQFAVVPTMDVVVAIMERISGLCYHLFATCLIFQAVTLKKYWYYPLAIGAYTLFHSLTYFTHLGLPVLALEILWLVLGAAGILYVIRQKAEWPVAEAPVKKRLPPMPTRRLR